MTCGGKPYAMKKFCEYFQSQVREDIFIGQGTELQDPIPGTQIADVDLTPQQKQNKFKKKNAAKTK